MSHILLEAKAKTYRSRGAAIKICGVKSLSGARLAVDAGAKYIGLHVLNPAYFTDQRRSSYVRILDWIRGRCSIISVGDNVGSNAGTGNAGPGSIVPSDTQIALGGSGVGYEVPYASLPVKPVLLFNCEDADFIAHACNQLEWSLIQLHLVGLDISFARRLERAFTRQNLAPPRVIKLIASADGATAIPLHSALEELSAWLPVSYGILVDSQVRGGSGEVGDWRFAREIFLTSDSGEPPSDQACQQGVTTLPIRNRLRFIAGGLRPDNVISALQQTGADVADIQSSLEIRDRSGHKRKDISRVINATAAVNGQSPEAQHRAYIQRRAAPQLLFSPTEMGLSALDGLQKLWEENLDGIQIDISDGTAGVRDDLWPIPTTLWAAECWAVAPELPLWVHCFSTNPDWIREQFLAAVGANPHTLGLFVQPGDPGRAVEICSSLQELPGALIPSITCSQAIPITRELAASVPVWQVTLSSHEAHRKEEAASAIQRLQACGTNVRIDRGVTAEFLEALKSLPSGVAIPDGLTIGRGLFVPGITVDKIHACITLGS